MDSNSEENDIKIIEINEAPMTPTKNIEQTKFKRFDNVHDKFVELFGQGPITISTCFHQCKVKAREHARVTKKQSHLHDLFLLHHQNIAKSFGEFAFTDNKTKLCDCPVCATKIGK